MIKKLILSNYGKFINREFDLAPVTVFQGDNEAGKTTIYDALFDRLCKPRRGSEAIRLNERYDSARKADIEHDEGAEAPAFDPGEFANVYSINSVGINLDISDKSDWMKKVKSRLFEGGINPAQIKEGLDYQAAENAGYTHNRLLKVKNEKREGIAGRLTELRAQRTEILNDQRKLDDLKINCANLRKSVSEITGQLTPLKSELDLQAKIQNRRKCETALGIIDEQKNLTNELRGLATINKEGIPILDGMIAEETRLTREIAGLEGGLKAAKDSRQKADFEKKQLQSRANSQEMTKQTAERIIARISDYRPADIIVKSWNRALLAVAVVIFLAGSVSGFALPDMTTRIAAFVAGVIVSILLVVISRKSELRRGDPDADKLFFATLKDEWFNASGAHSGSETITGLQAEMVGKRVSFDSLRNQLLNIEKAIGDFDREISETSDKIAGLNAMLAARIEDRKKWFAGYGVGNRDEYVRKVNDRSIKAERLNGVDKQIDRLIKDMSCRNIDDLQQTCRRRLGDMDYEGVPKDGLSDLEINGLESRYKKLEEEYEANEARLQDVRNEITGLEGEIRGALGGLPAQIAGAEADLQKLDTEINEILTARRAAGIASRVFEDLMQDTDTSLKELAGELAGQFSELFDAERPVTVPELKTDEIRVTDEGGESRSVDYLSRGTRDLFLFAAKLVLARKATKEKALLVLDDPFLTLDDGRRDKAVLMLKKYFDQTGWQLILFTKDAALAGSIINKFNGVELKIHNLNVR